MSIKLSKRLLAVAEAVKPGARVIDVGTDHGMVSVWLAQTGRASHVWASDVRPGPLDSARRLVDETECGKTVSLRLTDGLSGFGPEDGDTVIIAGMGGETMVNILSQAPWTKENVLLILEPQSKQALLRDFLIQHGYQIFCESLVEDAGRIYPILLVRGGFDADYTPGELHVGRFDRIAGDRLFPDYLEGLMRRMSPAAEHDPQTALLLEEFRSMKERLAES